MKGRENSMPEKNRMNVRCVKFRRIWEFVLWNAFFPSMREEAISACIVFDVERDVVFASPFVVVPCSLASATLLGRVSGRERYRYIVSVTIKKRLKPAAVANGFAATVLMELNQAPSAGPKVKLMLKHIPTNAIVAPRCFSSDMSVAIAIAS
jgi:hypothetical protein